MAQRTISNTGGDFNNTATWVEGVVPTSADHIVATATSGQLTINVASTVQYADLSLYTNTLTFTSNLTLGLAAATTTFGSSMNFAGAGILICAVAHTFVQNTTNQIPAVRFGAGTKTLNTNLYVTTFEALGSFAANGNTIFISGNINTGIQGVTGTSILRLVGSGDLNAGNITNIVFDTVGTYNGSAIGLGLGLNSSATWISGTITNGRIKPTATTTITLDLGSSQWESFDSVTSGVALQLNSDFNVNHFTYNTGSNTTALTISGTGSLRATTVSLTSAQVNTTGVIQYRVPLFRLNTTGTHTIGKIVANGFAGIATNATSSLQYGDIRSTSSGVKTTINLTGATMDSSVSYFDLTDIDVTGNQLYVNNGTLTNTTNITTTPPSGGGGQFAFTYVN
jgi:hypothetical protein